MAGGRDFNTGLVSRWRLAFTTGSGWVGTQGFVKARPFLPGQHHVQLGSPKTPPGTQVSADFIHHHSQSWLGWVVFYPAEGLVGAGSRSVVSLNPFTSDSGWVGGPLSLLFVLVSSSGPTQGSQLALVTYSFRKYILPRPGHQVRSRRQVTLGT
ncbi:hypothetical protein BDN72DRAFT_97671 [Pluteus cervinus]|uniref:Uncharacterized protein n=1 Tax=Pluteus cervinus TaxID=181527 RepID=A0ACD3ANT9_9AGAR|nr:hypothetical protein BDN72DRAFT_97671 [Pluteus cervinus]